MTTYTLVTKQEPQTLEALIHEYVNASEIVIDTETTGLDVYGADRVVGIAFYFPAVDKAFYVDVAHGNGVLSEDSLDNVAHLGNSIHEKKKVHSQIVYDRYIKPSVISTNLSNEQLERLVGVMNEYSDRKVWYGHNINFDLAALWNSLGIEAPATCYDTIIAAHVIFTDWYACYFNMPDSGKSERGSTALKWQTRLFKVPGATDGIDNLKAETDAANTWLVAAAKEHKAALVKQYGAERGAEISRYQFKLSPREHIWPLKAEQVATYAWADVVLTWGLWKKQAPILSKWPGQMDVFKRFCDINRHVLHRMEITGLGFDAEQAAAMLALAGDQLEGIAAALPFDPLKTDQLANWLEAPPPDGLGITLPKTKKGNRQTNKRALLKYNDVPEVMRAQRYRTLNKMVSTYVKKWYEKHQDGVIYGTYRMATKTGRLSGDMQQIPRNTEDIIAPKKLLGALRPDYVFIEADYVSLEMMVGAWIAETVIPGAVNQWRGQPLSGSMALTERIESGIDIHAYNRDSIKVPELIIARYPGISIEAAMVQFFKDRDEYNPKWTADKLDEKFMKACRQIAKTVNFAIMYGSGVRGVRKALLEQANVSVTADEAKAMLAAWRSMYPAIPEAIGILSDSALSSRAISDTVAENHQYLRLPLAGLDLTIKFDYYSTRAVNEDGGIYNPKESEAHNSFNRLTQGTAALLTLDAARRLSLYFGDIIDLQATVHDSIEYSGPEPDLDDILRISNGIMTDYPIRPALQVEFEVARPGESWGDKTVYFPVD